MGTEITAPDVRSGRGAAYRSPEPGKSILSQTGDRRFIAGQHRVRMSVILLQTEYYRLPVSIERLHYGEKGGTMGNFPTINLRNWLNCRKICRTDNRQRGDG